MADTEATSELQVYSGYHQADVDLLRAYVEAPALLLADHFVDGFGVKTLLECVPFINATQLHIDRLSLPVPDDGFHAETIEYVALIDAIDRFGKTRFSSVELGAGWAPWIALAGVLARKRGVSDIELVGVEASNARFELMCRHLEFNGLRRRGERGRDARVDGTNTHLFEGAIWTSNGTVFFPECAVTDMGVAAAADRGRVDHWGLALARRPIPCLDLQTLLADVTPVDFMHIDIQGTELDVLTQAAAWMTLNVRSMLIATHDRTIEGRLIELLLARGWVLHREKPCRVDWARRGTLLARTTHDGSQYWINPALVGNIAGQSGWRQSIRSIGARLLRP